MRKIASALVLTLVMLASAWSEDGQLFVRTAPAQAQILVSKKEVVKFRINEVKRPTKDQSGQKEELVDTGEKSPAIIRLEVRKEPYEVTVRKEGYEEKTVLIAVDRTGIIKPEVINLTKLKNKVDIVTPEAGWSVFLDGQPAVDVEGKPAVTPCTVGIEDGVKQMTIAREGFFDQVYPVPERVAEMSQIKLERKAWKGKSSLLFKNPQDQSFDRFVGVWEVSNLKTRYWTIQLIDEKPVLEARSGYRSVDYALIGEVLVFKLENGMKLTIKLLKNKADLALYDKDTSELSKKVLPEILPLWKHSAIKQINSK